MQRLYKTRQWLHPLNVRQSHKKYPSLNFRSQIPEQIPEVYFSTLQANRVNTICRDQKIPHLQRLYFRCFPARMEDGYPRGVNVC
jgi:hypothetical protein